MDVERLLFFADCYPECGRADPVVQLLVMLSKEHHLKVDLPQALTLADADAPFLLFFRLFRHWEGQEAAFHVLCSQLPVKVGLQRVIPCTAVLLWWRV